MISKETYTLTTETHGNMIPLANLQPVAIPINPSLAGCTRTATGCSGTRRRRRPHRIALRNDARPRTKKNTAYMNFILCNVVTLNTELTGVTQKSRT